MSENINVRLESVKKIESGINITYIASTLTKSKWAELIDQDAMVDFAKDVIRPYEALAGITADEFPSNELTNLSIMANHSMWKSLTNLNVSMQESLLSIAKPESVFIASVFTNFASMASIQPTNLYALNTQHTEYAHQFFGSSIPEINVVTHQSLVDGEYQDVFDSSIIRFEYVAVDLTLLNSIISSTKSGGLILVSGSSDQGELYKSNGSFSDGIHQILNSKCSSVCHLPIGTGLTVAIK